jgi:hypothetical protein
VSMLTETNLRLHTSKEYTVFLCTPELAEE